MWNPVTGEQVRVLTNHTDYVHGLVFSPDSTRFVSAGRDKRVILWETATGQPMRTFQHPDFLRQVAYSPDGRRIVTAGGDFVARIWDVESGHERQWAATTVSKVLEQLRAEAVVNGHGELFGKLQGTLTGDRPSIAYGELATRLKMSEGAVKMAAHRLRERYRALFHAEIAHTVERPDEVAEEIAHLFQVLCL